MACRFCCFQKDWAGGSAESGQTGAQGIFSTPPGAFAAGHGYCCCAQTAAQARARHLRLCTTRFASGGGRSARRRCGGFAWSAGVSAHPLRQLAVLPARLYQWVISPLLPPSCRFTPTCSAYAIEAILTHGLVRGTGLAVWRLLRCNPWSAGGVDPVPPARVSPCPSSRGRAAPKRRPRS